VAAGGADLRGQLGPRLNESESAYLLSSLTLAACFIFDSLTLCRRASWSNLALAAGASGAVPDLELSSVVDFEGPEGGALAAGATEARGACHQPSPI
jgi:hypothetical protein